MTHHLLEYIYVILLLTLIHVGSPQQFGFTKGRKWYIGGDFSKSSISNFASFDGSSWSKLGNPNGIVQTIHIDLCLNVWIGGNFTHIDELETGPIAKYNYWTNSWESLNVKFQTLTNITDDTTNTTHTANINTTNTTNTNSTNDTSSNYGIVRAITTNCLQWNPCSCHVYFGGQFKIESNNEIIHAVAHHSPDGSVSSIATNEFTSKTIVHTLYKKNLGLSNAINYVWVGGEYLNGIDDGYFGRFDISSSTWTLFNEPNGPVYSFAYKSESIGIIDRLWLVGNFKFKTKDGDSCNHICSFIHDKKQFKPVLFPSQVSLVNGPVYDISRSDSNLYIVGNFTSGALKISNGKVSFINNDQTTSSTYLSVDSCARLDWSCHGGSVFLGGDISTFYNSKKNEWESIDINGRIYAIESAFLPK